MTKKNKPRQRKRAATEAQSCLLDALTVQGKSGRRCIDSNERHALIAMMLLKINLEALDVKRLTPQGSILARILRPFQQTDISFALPLFQLIMIAASWLTQNDAVLEVPGVGEIRPTLWTIGLAESGSSKTLAAERVMKILSGSDGPCPVCMFPASGSDAQWIQDLAENNGTYWFQDEVGKFFKAVLTQPNFARIKTWMLHAYSHQPISNRLKSERDKLEIAEPAFTFHGLSVLSTWQADVDAVSMLDGFCQRPNYYLAQQRTDSDMFDHFLYFSGEKVAEVEADLGELWLALCAQPGAAGPYRLGAEVLPHLQAWWESLRPIWGGGDVPGSFIRRIGFSVLRYLVVLHFLLGKSGSLIDVETAHLATRFAEYHLESTRIMLQTYDERAVQKVQKIAEVRSSLLASGKEATKREVERRLSRVQRQGLTGEAIAAILESLESVKVGSKLLDECTGPAPQRREALVEALHDVEKQLALSERKRNERRLRVLRAQYRATLDAEASSGTAARPGKPSENSAGSNILVFPSETGSVEVSSAVYQDHPLAHLL